MKRLIFIVIFSFLALSVFAADPVPFIYGVTDENFIEFTSVLFDELLDEEYIIYAGADYICPKESTVHSILSGTVKEIFRDTDFGTVVIIKHAEEEQVSTIYGYLKDIHLNIGDEIYRGQRVGTTESDIIHFAFSLHLDLAF